MNLDKKDVEERYKKIEELFSDDAIAENMLSDLEFSVLEYRPQVRNFDAEKKRLKETSVTESDYRTDFEEIDKSRTASHNGLINHFYPVNRVIIRKASSEGRLSEFAGGLYTGDPLDISKDNPRSRDAIALWSEKIEGYIENKHSDESHGDV